jgi:hypothetical protein
VDVLVQLVALAITAQISVRLLTEEQLLNMFIPGFGYDQLCPREYGDVVWNIEFTKMVVGNGLS